MVARLVRPAGIAILAFLAALEGIILLAAGLALALFFPILGGLVGQYGGLVALIGGVVGGVFIVFGLFNLIIAYGYWNGSNWTWWVGLVLAILGVVRALFSMPVGFISLIINGLIIYYLTRRHVEQYFGRIRQLAPLPSPPTSVPSPLSVSPPGSIQIRCPNCGALNVENAKFCRSCGRELAQ